MIIPIPLGRTWTVTLRGQLEGTYKCAGCGYSTPVVINTTTQGQGVSPLYLADESAQEHARKQAQRAVNADAQLRLDLLVCPKCKAPGPATRRIRRTQWLHAGLWSGLLFVVIAVFGALAGAANDSNLTALAGLPIGLAAAAPLFLLISWFRMSRQLKSAARSVELGARLEREPEPAPARAPAPAPARAAPEPVPAGGVSCAACGKACSARLEYCPHCLASLNPMVSPVR